MNSAVTQTEIRRTFIIYRSFQQKASTKELSRSLSLSCSLSLSLLPPSPSCQAKCLHTKNMTGIFCTSIYDYATKCPHMDRKLADLSVSSKTLLQQTENWLPSSVSWRSNKTLLQRGKSEFLPRFVKPLPHPPPPSKLQALVYDILPSTTAVFSYAVGSRELSANEQFCCCCFLVLKPLS